MLRLLKKVAGTSFVFIAFLFEGKLKLFQFGGEEEEGKNQGFFFNKKLYLVYPNGVS